MPIHELQVVLINWNTEVTQGKKNGTVYNDYMLMESFHLGE